MQIKTYLPIKIVSLVIASFIALKAFLSFSGIVLIRNVTPSLPLGFYYQTSEISWKRGEVVSVKMPEELQKKLLTYSWFKKDLPFLKVVSALPGDRVCYTKSRIRINGRVSRKIYRDEAKRMGIEERFGCVRLKKDEFLALNKDYRHSIDSRYFGPFKKKDARGRVSPILVYKLRSV